MSKRTTFTSDDDDYLTLEREADRRGIAVAHMIREAVAEYAAEIRAGTLPSFGYASGGAGLAEESGEDPDAPILRQTRSERAQPG